MSTGKNIRAARKYTKTSQKSLAESAGINPSLLSQYETERKTPKPETIAKIANALGLSYSYDEHGDAVFHDISKDPFAVSNAVNKLLKSLGYRTVWDEEKDLLGLQGHKRFYKVTFEDLQTLSDEIESFFDYKLHQLLEKSELVWETKSDDKKE